MKALRRRPERNESGAAAVELALILPVLLTIVLGIIEFGYLFFVQASVSGAARDAVRVYAIHNDTVAATTVVNGAVPDPTKVTSVTFAPVCATDLQATAIVTYQYQSLTGWLDFAIGASPVITGKGTMRCEG